MLHKRINKLFYTLFFVLGIFLGIFDNAEAGIGNHKLTGYAWSPNIGWVSFSCTNDSSCSTSNYGVEVDSTTGVLTGYAWSSNVGWISFQESSGCPISDYGCRATAVLSTTATSGTAFPHIVGWARAVNASSVTNGGWDGWISLSCYNSSICGTSNFGVKIPNENNELKKNGGNLSGYAWGSNVVGWIDFSKVVWVPGESELTLVSDKTNVAKDGDKVELTWDSPTDTTYSSCTASGGGSDWNGARSTTLPATLEVAVSNNPTTFKIECEHADGVDEAEVTVSINYVWDITLTPNPAVVLSGGSSTLSWATTGDVPPGTTCAASLPANWTTKTTYSGSEVINNIVNGISRYYQCTPIVGQPKTAQANVRVLSLATFTTDSCYKANNGGPTLSWSAPNAQSCVITDPNSVKYTVGASGIRRIASGSGTYTIECSAGSVSVTGSVNATQCSPDYTMIPITMCDGKSGTATANSFQQKGNPNNYEAVVEVKSSAEQGFTSDLEHSLITSLPTGITATWSPSPAIVGQPLYTASLTLRGNLNTIKNWLDPLPNKTINLTISADTNPTPGNYKTAQFSVCAPDGGSTKPIFIEQ